MPCVNCYHDPEGHDTMGDILSKSNMEVKLWPGRSFSVYVHGDLDFGYVTLAQGHDTPLGHGQ